MRSGPDSRSDHNGRQQAVRSEDALREVPPGPRAWVREADGDAGVVPGAGREGGERVRLQHRELQALVGGGRWPDGADQTEGQTAA